MKEQDTPYYRFNREERNLAALLYHLWLHDPANLGAFLNLVNPATKIDPAQCEVYYEFAMLRDLWEGMDKDSVHSRLKPPGDDRRKAFVLNKLPPTIQAQVKEMEPKEWNEHFKVAGKRSTAHYQSPGRWSPTDMEDVSAKDLQLMLRMKWCFNLKPDLVIITADGSVISIEAKLVSDEDKYTAMLPNGARYSISQRECQSFMFTEMLEISEAKFKSFLLVRDNAAGLSDRLTWSQAFEAMDTTSCHPFVKRWLDENTVYKARVRP